VSLASTAWTPDFVSQRPETLCELSSSRRSGVRDREGLRSFQREQQSGARQNPPAPPKSESGRIEGSLTAPRPESIILAGHVPATKVPFADSWAPILVQHR
jgi:hypothetical protein